jgi:hypothetical protein
MFTPTLYYRYKYDAFTSIRKSIGDSVVLTTIENLDNQQSTGLEMTLSGDVSRKWNLDLSGDLFYTRLDAENLGYSNKAVFSATAKLSSFFKLAGLTLFQLNAFYYSPYITPQGRRNQYFYVNAGLRQQLLKKRAALTLTVSDVLHSYRIKRVIETPELNQIRKSRREEPAVYLGITWRFKNRSDDRKNDLDFEGFGTPR